MVLMQIRAAELRKILVELGPVRLFPNIEVFLKKKKKLKFHVEQSLNFYLFVQYYKFLFPFWFGQQYDIHGILNLSKMAQRCRIDLGKTGLYAWGWA